MSREIAWEPTEYHASESNIAQFMDAYGYEYDDLVPETETELARIWGDMAVDTDIVWRTETDTVVDTSDGVEFAHLFPGGELNAAETILDQWVDSAPDRPMYVWEDERGNVDTVTYEEMARRSNRLANAMRAQGIGEGDVVGLVFPMHPNGFAAAVACLRLGAVFTQIFPGYGAEAMAHRLDDAGAEMLLVADGYQRGGSTMDLLEKVDGFLADTPTVEDVVVYEHVGIDRELAGSSVHDWDGFVADQDDDIESAVVPSEHPAFIAYSSGTTGAPKGTIHTHASLLLMGNKEGRFQFDLGEGDTLMWVTDFGWVIVPIWMLAGGPALGATTVLLEGSPTDPDEDRIWKAIAEHGVTTFGISPTGARNLREIDDSPRESYDLSSLRVLGSTGEPWDEEGWRWFLEAVGGGECPIINASGGTELAGAILSPTPVSPLKPGTLFGPAPGVAANIYDEQGTPADEGYLVVEQPMPGMTHSLTTGDERYLDEYWRDFDGVWNQNDWAERDEDGFWYITGRADDTMNVAGRRVTAPAIEEVIVEHAEVHEATVVPVPGDGGGQVPVAFVTLLEDDDRLDADVGRVVKEAVAENLGAPFRPDEVHIVSALPRTQSGKIPRGVIESAYLGEATGNVSTLDNADVLDTFPSWDEA